MADREPDLSVRLGQGVAALDPAQWNALAGPDPFLSHAFLAALERSGSVGGDSGWSPLPLLVDREETTLAAVPAYLKGHSQGEYVFDHGWADAYERAGGHYYPKLQVAVPFTPVPGRRLLGDAPAALAALEAVTRQNGLSSAHVTFCTADEAAAATPRGWLERLGIQYHWFNRGYADFDGFLAALASRKRKAIRKERAAACEGLTIETLTGPAITAEAWDAMWAFYQDTGARKWGQPYLTRAFFDLIAESMADQLLLFLARRDGVPVAGALNVIGDGALYGRYWGCLADIPGLHFELSYYRAIDWAIAHGFSEVQAGAQGEHKLARGYEPVLTRSLHYLPDPAFRTAVARYLEGERAAILAERDALLDLLPYRSSP